MRSSLTPFLAVLLCCGLADVLAAGEPLSIFIAPPRVPSVRHFKLGAATAPNGATFGADSQSLLFNGTRIMPVMGEFHYSRFPEGGWKEELLKMKAGGVTVVSTYVFWIHHEEVEGTWDWAGQKDLRRFVETCKEVGLDVAVRCGPWCHGEVRNGGLPDWLLTKGLKVRSTDPVYLGCVHELYSQIAAQIKGLLWKDGGPVIAIQVDNEYGGPAAYLLALKQMAREVGLDVPFYTRTGWPELKTPMPFGELLPLYGSYAEGFWDRELTSMPGNYKAAFRFWAVRTDTAIANEQLGKRVAADDLEASQYPYLTCELGGGMLSSYHRRISIDPIDIESVALIRLGAGGNLPGFYMYHGGTNPESRLSSLNEEQDTAMTNWNDMPQKDYDFYAPIGAGGETRPHYHWLRRLNLFVKEFGPSLAGMAPSFPSTTNPGGLRWAVRSDGRSGYLFANNHERGIDLGEKKGIQFNIQSSDGALLFPKTPVDIANDAIWIWPFRLSLGHNVELVYATAQLVCSTKQGQCTTYFFAANPLPRAEFGIRSAGATIEPLSGSVASIDGMRVVKDVRPARRPALRIVMGNEEIRIVLLSQADSLALWSSGEPDPERIYLSPADSLIADSEKLIVSSEESDRMRVWKYDSSNIDDPFVALPLDEPDIEAVKVSVELTRAPGAARSIPMGKAPKPVAAEPTDSDFAASGEWKFQVDGAGKVPENSVLRIHYRGDVARVLVGGHLVLYNFYNGRYFDVPFALCGDALRSGKLTLQILSLEKNPPVYFSSPDVAAPINGISAVVESVEFIEPLTATAPVR